MTEASVTPFADSVRQAREHYEEVSSRAMSWSSSIRLAIDAWEREPGLIAKLTVLARLQALCDEQRDLIADLQSKLNEAQLELHHEAWLVTSYKVTFKKQQAEIILLQGQLGLVRLNAQATPRKKKAK